MRQVHGVISERPQRPAEAYAPVAGFLDRAGWWDAPSPPNGMRCRVFGTADRMVTEWKVAPHTAEALYRFVQTSTGLVWGGAEPFTGLKAAS